VRTSNSAFSSTSCILWSHNWVIIVLRDLTPIYYRFEGTFFFVSSAEDRRCWFLRNVGKYVPDCTASHSRKR
jgi:hypothetical protein